MGTSMISCVSIHLFKIIGSHPHNMSSCKRAQLFCSSKRWVVDLFYWFLAISTLRIESTTRVAVFPSQKSGIFVSLALLVKTTSTFSSTSSIVTSLLVPWVTVIGRSVLGLMVRQWIPFDWLFSIDYWLLYITAENAKNAEIRCLNCLKTEYVVWWMS